VSFGRVPVRASLAARLAAAGAVFGLLIMLVGMGVGYWALSRQLDARSIAELNGKRDLVVHLLSEAPTTAALVSNRHRFNDVLIGHEDLHLALVDVRTGTLLASFSDVAAQSIATMDANAQGAFPLRWAPRGGGPMEALRGEAPLADGAPVRYYVSLDRGHDAQLLRGFVQASLLGAPVLLGLVALGAWLIARTGLEPLRRFRRLAAMIGAQSLDRRVSEADLPAELGELAREFNAMLERIDHGYQRLQEFSADLAHELRTPIATLMGRHQVTLSQERSPLELRDVLEGDVEELDRLSRVIADMLFLAQAEHGPSVLKTEPVDLQAEVQRVADYLSVIADEKDVRVSVAGRAVVAADPLLVQRAITNLMSNAVRHARAGSAVQVTVSSLVDAVRLEVANKGDAIAPENLERIFDRFFRVDASRARLSGGTGLGLAIVRSIMQAHGGEVSARSDAALGETVFTLVFPTESARPNRAIRTDV
jgi:two-component system heavy metal sensor histidine kinase CusS